MALLMPCLACTSLQDLSSYSAGSLDAASPQDPTPPVEDGSDVPPPSTPDAGAPEVTGVEVQNSSVVPLIPAASADAGTDCTAPGEFTAADATSCYLLGDAIVNWNEARELCQDWGGDLAKVESAEENALLSERTGQSAWLGATDSEDEGTFRWVDGDEVDADGFWGPAQPDNFEGIENCIELREPGTIWNDVPCTSEKLPLCERALGGEAAP